MPLIEYGKDQVWQVKRKKKKRKMQRIKVSYLESSLVMKEGNS